MKARDLIKEIKEYKDYDVSYEYIGKEPGCRCGYCYSTQDNGLEKDQIKVDKKTKQIILKTGQ
jgi:hypothetical protein